MRLPVCSNSKGAPAHGCTRMSPAPRKSSGNAIRRIGFEVAVQILLITRSSAFIVPSRGTPSAPFLDMYDEAAIATIMSRLFGCDGADLTEKCTPSEYASARPRPTQRRPYQSPLGSLPVKLGR